MHGGVLNGADRDQERNRRRPKPASKKPPGNSGLVSKFPMEWNREVFRCEHGFSQTKQRLLGRDAAKIFRRSDAFDWAAPRGTGSRLPRARIYRQRSNVSFATRRVAALRLTRQSRGKSISKLGNWNRRCVCCCEG